MTTNTNAALTEDQWLGLADLHANADWNCEKPDGFLNAVKALCADFAAITTAAVPPEGWPLASAADRAMRAQAAPVAQWDALTQAARDVLAEVERATRKFPTWPTDPLHALAVLGEEFGELTKDMLQLTYEPHKTSTENVRTEAMQTAAMALRLYMSLEGYEYKACEQHSQAKEGQSHE